ncbi:hypothetical protein [Streptomyces sp. SID11385]|uniref:hypothetical protein n=1 Tax=Streptomyces sp. SID11385 TaxID=2706031 RepID=UPI0013C78AA4|nr:hypothetical protein [Streptomyces sp. SID11385]NEA39919.1 hypothetical protein [Streptomyces sp. SID11385]
MSLPPRAQRFTLPWGVLDVFTTGSPMPPVLHTMATALTRLNSPRFRPSLLHFGIWPDRPPVPYVAVWPPDMPMPDPGEPEPDPSGLDGVVFAEIHALTCRVCAAHVEAVRPDLGVPAPGAGLSAHRLVNACPHCRTASSRSRIQALALIPPPDHADRPPGHADRPTP